MRYDPRRQIQFPSEWTWNLWNALDKVCKYFGLTYEKIVWVAPEDAHYPKENWFVPARLSSGVLIEWDQNWYRRKKNGRWKLASPNGKTCRLNRKKRYWWDKQGLRVIYVRRNWTSEQMLEHIVKEMMKGGVYAGANVSVAV